MFGRLSLVRCFQYCLPGFLAGPELEASLFHHFIPLFVTGEFSGDTQVEKLLSTPL